MAVAIITNPSSPGVVRGAVQVTITGLTVNANYTVTTQTTITGNPTNFSGNRPFTADSNGSYEFSMTGPSNATQGQQGTSVINVYSGSDTTATPLATYTLNFIASNATASVTPTTTTTYQGSQVTLTANYASLTAGTTYQELVSVNGTVVRTTSITPTSTQYQSTFSYTYNTVGTNNVQFQLQVNSNSGYLTTATANSIVSIIAKQASISLNSIDEDSGFVRVQFSTNNIDSYIVSLTDSTGKVLNTITTSNGSELSFYLPNYIDNNTEFQITLATAAAPTTIIQTIGPWTFRPAEPEKPLPPPDFQPSMLVPTASVLVPHPNQATYTGSVNVTLEIVQRGPGNYQCYYSTDGTTYTWYNGEYININKDTIIYAYVVFPDGLKSEIYKFYYGINAMPTQTEQQVVQVMTVGQLPTTGVTGVKYIVAQPYTVSVPDVFKPPVLTYSSLVTQGWEGPVTLYWNGSAYQQYMPPPMSSQYPAVGGDGPHSKPGTAVVTTAQS